MTKRERNISNMYAAVYGVGEEHSETFAGVPKLGTNFGALKNVHREININELILTGGTKGSVASKNVSKEELIDTGLVLAGVLYSYAVDTKNIDLKVLTDLNRTNFKRFRESHVPVKVEELLDKADAIGEALIPYGLTAEKRAAARTQLEDYIVIFTTVNTSKAAKNAAREVMTLLFEKADEILIMLDKLMVPFQKTNPEVYFAYKSSRNIIDVGSKKTTEPEPVPAP